MSRENEWSDEEIQDELDDLNAEIRKLRTALQRAERERDTLLRRVEAGSQLAAVAKMHCEYHDTLIECRDCDPTVGFTCVECSIALDTKEALAAWLSASEGAPG